MCRGLETWPYNLLRNQVSCRRHFKLDFREEFKGVKAKVGEVLVFLLAQLHFFVCLLILRQNLTM